MMRPPPALWSPRIGWKPLACSRRVSSAAARASRPCSKACPEGPARELERDVSLLDQEGLDAADEGRAVGEQALHLGRGVIAFQGLAVVEPELRHAIDLHGRGGNVGPR